MKEMSQEYNLLLEMRKATRRSHHIANALILSKLVVVLTDKQLYARALGSFYPVYSKLEEVLQKHSNVPCLAPVVSIVSKVPRTTAMEQVSQVFCPVDHPRVDGCVEMSPVVGATSSLQAAACYCAAGMFKRFLQTFYSSVIRTGPGLLPGAQLVYHGPSFCGSRGLRGSPGASCRHTPGSAASVRLFTVHPHPARVHGSEDTAQSAAAS